MEQAKEHKTTEGGGSKHGKKGNVEVDFGVGKFSVGGLFSGVEKLVDVASKLQEAGGGIKGEEEIDLSHLKEGMKGIFGFSIKSSVGGIPIVESFGNIKKTTKGPSIDEEQEPITDIFDEEEAIKVYVEIPGVSEEDIKLDLKGDILDISGQGGTKKYHKEILLPSQAENITSSYKNGILEITLKKIR